MITITGDLGSGKSTAGKLLAKHFSTEFISTGQIQRKLADKLGMSILDLNISAEKTKSLDTDLDAYIRTLSSSPLHTIIDSRLAWHFIPESFKVYLSVDPNISAHRVLSDTSRNSESYTSVDNAKELILERRKCETERFKSLYNVECEDLSNYDLVIDTSFQSPDTVFASICAAYTNWTNHLSYAKMLFSPQRLFPTHDVRQLASERAKEIYTEISVNGFNFAYPIEALYVDKQLYIFDGHKRLSAVLLSDPSILVPVQILAKEDEIIFSSLTAKEYVKAESSMSLVYDWEDCHSFTFQSYPDILNRGLLLPGKIK